MHGDTPANGAPAPRHIITLISLSLSVRCPAAAAYGGPGCGWWWSQRYRYTEWLLWNGSALAPAWSAPPVARELYDHLGDDGPWTDPDRYENVNLVPTAEPALLAALATQLREAFRAT